MDQIVIRNAHEHNLKHVNLTIPRNKLVVITGVSGSGKSSLAFDTLYVEGQRRYIESLSTYAKQFIGQFEKPAVESIEGLSPTISIDQKSTSRSPRSTVGTVTEIYDLLRVLYARIGTPHCPKCQQEIQPQSADRMVESLMQFPEGSRLQILAPVVRGRKGEYNALFRQLRKEGYARVRINGETRLLEELPEDFRLPKTKTHRIDVVIDRIVAKPEAAVKERLTSAVSTALKRSDGYMIVEEMQTGDSTTEHFFSRHLACPQCDNVIDDTQAGASASQAIEEMAPRLFSFNSPYGACPACQGLGVSYHLSETLLVPDDTKTLLDGAIPAFQKLAGRYYKGFLRKLAKQHHIQIETPYKALRAAEKQWLLYGDTQGSSSLNAFEEGEAPVLSDEEADFDWFSFAESFDGVLNILRRQLADGTDATREYLSQFLSETACSACRGARLKPVALSVQLGGLNIQELCELSLDAAYVFVATLPESLSNFQKTVGQQALFEVAERLRFLKDVGLSYLTLSRPVSTLSGGEMQRIRLASQIGVGLSGVLYVLDEPSIGLHPHNNRQLIQTLLKLRDQGNSLVVVEHDEDMMRAADWLIDMGPGAGVYGGSVVREDRPAAFETPAKNVSPSRNTSLTEQYLSGKKQLRPPAIRRPGSGKSLTVKNATLHNLKNISVQFPLGCLIAVTGLSGSGKSTLVFDVLHQALAYQLGRHRAKPQGVGDITGLEAIDKCIHVDQSPIGKTSRSNPATYTGAMDAIRAVFAQTEAAQILGYDAGFFSFNLKKGQCPACKGEGATTVAMNLLPDVRMHCDACNGTRYNPSVLAIPYRGKTIADVLAMEVREALRFFETHPTLGRMLRVLEEVGLGYLQLGQPAPTLSGGEAQRLKLASELGKRSTGKTLYLLDEPTVGLHWQDIEHLLVALNRLVDEGNTVIVIEHQLDLINSADYVIDLGPEAGETGGELVVAGTPEAVKACAHSYTGQALAGLHC